MTGAELRAERHLVAVSQPDVELPAATTHVMALLTLLAELVTPATNGPAFAALLAAGLELPGRAGVIVRVVAGIRAAGGTDTSPDAVLRVLHSDAIVGRGQRLSDVTRYLTDALTGPVYPERWPQAVAELAAAAHIDRVRRTVGRMTQALDECPATDLLGLLVAEGREVRASHERMVVALARIGEAVDG